MARPERSPEAEAYNYASFCPDAADHSRFRDWLHVGDEAPAFDLPTVDAGRFRSADWRGKAYIALMFGSFT